MGIRNGYYLNAGQKVPRKVKLYSFNGIAGCVSQHRNQVTKTVVGVYRNDQCGLDDSEPWSTVCEDHGHVVCHDTLKLAQYHSADPAGWCESCMEVQDKKETNASS
jgi:hypothetical protein